MEAFTLDICVHNEWSGPMEVRALSESERRAREEGVAFAAHYLGQEPPFSDTQAQELYDALLTAGTEHENAQIAVGLVLGEMMVKTGRLEWVRIIDEHGEETGLCHKAAKVVCHPISMVQKRLSQREHVDMRRLCDATIETLDEMANSGKYPLN